MGKTALQPSMQQREIIETKFSFPIFISFLGTYIEANVESYLES